MKFVQVALMLVLLGFWISPTLAERRCPDGYFPIGDGGASWEDCAPMGAMKAR